MKAPSPLHRSPARRVLVLALGVVLLLALRFLPDGLLDSSTSTQPLPTPPIVAEGSEAPEIATGDLETGRQRILEAFERRESGIWVEADGHVLKTLRNDNEGSRHQKFLVELDRQTLLISHNIDLAPRVPLSPGDRVVFRGRYEWNERGGVVHWTHHDPQGRSPGGWITHGNRTYR